MRDEALRIEGVGKRRGSRAVLSDVSLLVRSGERVALLGHNGAGKSTLMKIALGLTPASSGTVAVAGAAPGTMEARRATAYLPEAVTFHKALTGREQLTLFARLAGVSKGVVAALLDRVGLTEAADRRLGTYSKGMRQRLGMAQVLLGKPKVVLLDEPTSGLDPTSRRELYAIIDELAAGGAAVLIASHALTEVEARAERIAIMKDGRLVADDTLPNLSERAGLPIRLRVTASSGAADHVADMLGGTRVNGMTVDLQCPANGKMDRLRRIVALGDAVADFDISPPNLEDLYRHYSTEAPR
ncbi:ABC transporter ATP-binding protein [Pikeienuella sp. HZG-20]|uniref:ABC transporter ATP-binding protein n=1 Tax=Paludibacillus litoralis TaxID=3133267 RepID=UPI0030ED2D8D